MKKISLIIATLLSTCIGIGLYENNSCKKAENKQTEIEIVEKEIINGQVEIRQTKKENLKEKKEVKKQHNNSEKQLEKIQEPEKKYTDDELYSLSHLIYAEAGCCSDEVQIGVGSVLLNRVNSERFPNTINDVIFQEGQYACTWDGNFWKEPDERAINNAIYLLENGSQFPNYVIFQADFVQGDSVYAIIENVVFCYYVKDALEME